MRLLTKQVKLFHYDGRLIGQFDLFKGAYGIFMLFQHACFPYIINASMSPGHSKLLTAIRLLGIALAYASGVLFMLICGMEFRKKPMRRIVISQIKYIWRPYLLAVLAASVLLVLVTRFTGGDAWAELRRKVLPLVCGNVEGYDYFGIVMDDIGPMWFIIVFVVGGIMLNAILQIKDEILQCVAVFLLYELGTLPGFGPLWLPYSLPFGIYRAMKYTMYMYLGWQIKKKSFFDRRFPVWIIILAVLLVLPAIYYRRTEAVFMLIIAFGMLAIFQWLDGQKLKCLNWFRWFGKRIMPLCCIHTVFYIALPREYIDQVFAGRPFAGAMITLAVYLVTGIGGCILIDRIKRRRMMKKIRQKAIGGN